MSTILTDTFPTTEHPEWCDLLFCDAGEHVDVRHTTTPRRWVPADDDVEVRVAVLREDERTLLGEHAGSRVGVELALENLACLSPGGEHLAADVFLSPDDAERLAAALVEHAALARAAAADESTGSR